MKTFHKFRIISITNLCTNQEGEGDKYIDTESLHRVFSLVTVEDGLDPTDIGDLVELFRKMLD